MLEIILYILLFIVCISVLIVVHELGHFTMAKAFKVYCLEFSIGMGPAIYKHKRKNGETTFSFRAVPFGGYVSMYGEGVELPEGVQIDNSRSLNGIKKWKRAVVLLAGVFMNAILALVLFFVSASCFTQKGIYVNQIQEISVGSASEVAGLLPGDIIDIKEYSADQTYYVISDNSTLVYNDDKTIQLIALFNGGKLNNYANRDFSYYLEFYPVDNNGQANFALEISPSFANLKQITMPVKVIRFGEDDERQELDKSLILEPKVIEDKKVFDVGITYVYFEYRNTAKESAKIAFDDFGYSSTIIVRSLGSLFTSKESWSNVGGIVAIGFESSSILKNLGWAKFIYLWGMISVNLAIINLLPFPGLDGWQLLVLIIEAIIHKEIPNKVKNIISFIGLAILMLLMVLILFKDLFSYIFLVL